MFADAPFADRPFAAALDVVGFSDGVAEATGTFKYILCAATQSVATNADDSVMRSRPFRGTLRLPLNFEWSILGSDIGTFTTGTGTTVLDNSDGFYDDLPSTFTVDGRPIEIKAWRKGDDFAAAFTVFKGVMASWFIDEVQVAIDIRDFGYKLGVSAQPNLYGGTGGMDGGADLAQKRKPLVFGFVEGWSATLLDGAYLTYQVHDGRVHSIFPVYDMGAVLALAADYPDYASLQAASIPEGCYATCLALGLFRLNANPLGQVTADVRGDMAGGVFVWTTADIVRRWLTRVADVRDPDDLYGPSFDSLNVNQPAPVGYGVGPDDSHTIADVIADLMHGIGGWGGFRKNGLFEVRRFAAPSASAMMTLSTIDIFELKREAPPSGLMPPPFRQRVSYRRNWTVMSSFAGVVAADRKAYLASPYLISEASAVSIKADHPFAQDPDVRECYFRDKADSDAEAQRLLDLYRVERALYRITGPRKLLHQNLGDTVNVTFPRWDLSVGRNMRLVKITANPQKQEGQVDNVEWVCYG
jgi:hypothetical protein